MSGRLLPGMALALIAPIALAAGCVTPAPSGPYALEDGRLVSIRAGRYRVFETGESRSLHRDGAERWVAGHTFSSDPPPQLVDLTLVAENDDASRLRWERAGEKPLVAQRVELERRTAQVDVGDASLYTELLLPPGPGPFPAVVAVHGSGSRPATDYYWMRDFLAAYGVAAVVYDKRGTGRSGGAFTMNFSRLANDAVAVVDWLRQQPGIDPDRIGLSGYSQGGWVAPLAASRSPYVSFVLVSYGMVDSPAEEARIETLIAMHKRGVTGHRELEQIDELVRAGVAVVAGEFRDPEAWGAFEEVVSRYDDEPWMDELGSPLADLVFWPHWVLRLVGAWVLPSGLDWYYDSAELLDGLEVPMVWFVAELDESAPPRFTREKLSDLEIYGKPVEMIVFPGTDHGILQFEFDGSDRVYTGYHPSYFPLLIGRARALAGEGADETPAPPVAPPVGSGVGSGATPESE